MTATLLPPAEPAPARVPDRPRPSRRPRPDQVALAALLAGTTALYTVALPRSGWGNAFYAGAAQAGAASWRAWFFGASDAGGSITVDKPPASLWVMGLSVRLFGLSSWSLLVPEALMGVLAVAVLAAAVRRVVGPWPGLLAGLLLALTPVAAVMFRYDNPDALLTLLVVLAGWAVTRALEDGRTRWLVLAGALVGTAFLAKSLQAFLVVPALALAYLVAGPPRLRRRLGQLLAAGSALVVAGGWWVAVVALVPRADRPWVGGTTDDSPLSLALGYNGLGRLDGDEAAGGAGLHHGSSVWRLLGSGGDEAGWLLPVAVLALLAGLLVVGRAARTDRVRGALLLWGGWLLVTGLVLSTMKGIEHSYYAVELAPAIGATTAIGGAVLWRRGRLPARVLTALGVAVGTAWAVVVVRMHLHPAWAAGKLELVVGGLGAVAVLALLTRRRWAVGVAVLALCAGPLVWSVSTAAATHTGSNVYATPPPTRLADWSGPRSSPDDPGISPVALQLIRAGADGYTWAAATTGHRGAAVQLAAGAPVMDIGGFAGTDPSTTLDAFTADVAAHRVHYYVVGAGGGEDAERIRTWVTAHGTAVPAGRTELYDLSGLASS